MSDKCPLTGLAGRRLRRRFPEDLASSYRTHLGNSLPDEFIQKYFQEPIQEYESAESGLRWFSPCILAEPDFYWYLGKTYHSYYNQRTWDKVFALRLLKHLHHASFLEIGCGDGLFLSMAGQAGIHGIGVDTNSDAIAKARSHNYEAYTPTDLPDHLQFSPTLCLFQTLEHVPDPCSLLKDYVSKSNCTNLIITVPCYQSYLGYSSDPLVWPPHHFTFWSERALRVLASMLGFRVIKMSYQPMRMDDFLGCWLREQSDDLPLGPFRLTKSPSASRLRYLYAKYFLGKLFCYDWAWRCHSLLALMQR